MRKIEQVSEIAAIFKEVHNCEVTVEDLLELERYNAEQSRKRRAALSVSGQSGLVDYDYDIGKAIGFVIGAVLGAFFLPGLGIAAGWFTGALIGGAIGYRLVGLFDNEQRSAPTTTVDPVSRFSGVGNLGVLNNPIPLIYGDRKTNSFGGVLFRDPTPIYTRVTSSKGLQYLTELCLIGVGELGKVDEQKMQINDQPIINYGSDIEVEVSPGLHNQTVLGDVSHYSQAVTIASNNFIGLTPVGSTRIITGARGGAGSPLNIVGGSFSSGVYTRNNDLLGGNFTIGGAMVIGSTYGSYVFSSAKGEANTSGVFRWGLGFVKSTQDPLVFYEYPFAVLIYNTDGTNTNWRVTQEGVVIEQGFSSLVAPNSVLEVRVYRAFPSRYCQAIVDGVELWRGTFDLPDSLISEVTVETNGMKISSPRQGAINTPSSAGDIAPGLGTRFSVLPALLPKLRAGQTFLDSQGNSFVLVSKNNIDNWIETSPAIWISDTAGMSSSMPYIPAIGTTGRTIFVGYKATITTTKKVNTVDLVMVANVWAQNSSNAYAAHAQAFKIEIEIASQFVTLAQFIYSSSTEKSQNLIFTITDLPKAIYNFRILPLAAEEIKTSIRETKESSGGAVNIPTAVSIGGQEVRLLAEIGASLTPAAAAALMSFTDKPRTNSDQGPSFSLTHINEIVSNSGIFQAPESVLAFGNGDGLLGEYYNNTNFTGLAFSRVDQVVDFNWSTTTPPSNGAVTLQNTSYSIRWTGSIEAVHTGTHSFGVLVDDGMRIWVNEVQLLSLWKDGAPREVSAGINLTAGKRYSIVLEYYNNTGSGVISLRWTTPQQSKSVIAKTHLFSGVAPPAPAIAAITPGTTYPGYTIGFTKILASDRLQSVPAKTYDIPEGQVIRQHLVAGTLRNFGSSGEYYLSKPLIVPDLIEQGDIVRILGKGARVIGNPPNNLYSVTCPRLTSNVELIAGSAIITVSAAVWASIERYMPIACNGIPAGAIALRRYPGNKVLLADEWGRRINATVTGTRVAIINDYITKADGDLVVIYRMGASNYFPDLYVDRLINKRSGLGNLVAEDRAIHYQSIVESRNFCIKNKFFFDGVVNGQGSFEQWAIESAPSSLLFVTEIEGKYALIPQENEKVSYLFNNSNTTSYKSTLIPWSQKTTNAILVKYQDNLGRELQLKILTQRAFDNIEQEITQTIDTKGVTDPAQAIRIGQVALKSLILQDETCQIETDIAHGFYTRQGKIVTTSHVEIHFPEESSGFVMSAGLLGDSRSKIVSTVPIATISSGFIVTTAEHNVKIVNGEVLDSIVISGSSATNNGSYLASQIAYYNNSALVVTQATPTTSVTGGTLTVQRQVYDQVIRISDPVTISPNSRITITHRSSLYTEMDLPITDLGSGLYLVSGCEETIAFGDAFAIGLSTEAKKIWRITKIQPDVQNNSVTIEAIKWDADILNPAGLVTVQN